MYIQHIRPRPLELAKLTMLIESNDFNDSTELSKHLPVCTHYRKTIPNQQNNKIQYKNKYDGMFLGICCLLYYLCKQPASKQIGNIYMIHIHILILALQMNFEIKYKIVYRQQGD